MYGSRNLSLKLEKFSADPFFSKELTISQPEKGYRFSMDPYILAAHVQPRGVEHVIDVGCGCAIIPLILASRYPFLRITGVEIQKELSDFARQNIMANQFETIIRIIHEDIKKISPFLTDGKADIIVSNPPYKKKDSGRLNTNVQKAIARHEITLDIDTVFECSKRLLKTGGRVYIIFPAERISDLILAMERYQFNPEMIRCVHIKKNQPARRIIVCAVKNSSRPCVVKPPLYIYTSKNKLSHAYTSLFKP